MAKQAPGSESAPRIDPEESRPVSFHERAQDGVRVKNKQKGMSYALVSKDSISLQTYVLQGYKRVPRTADGPYIFDAEASEDIGASDTVEFMGHVLMAIPTEKLNANRKHGVPSIGAKGSDACDAIEKAIVKQGGVDDPMRNSHRNAHFMSFESNTTPLTGG